MLSFARKMACALASGKIVVRDIVPTNATTISFVEKLAIPATNPFKKNLMMSLTKRLTQMGQVFAAATMET